MAYRQTDPARLEGEALRRWYLRSPSDIEIERQVAASQRFNAFFSRGNGSSEPSRPQQDQTPDRRQSLNSPPRSGAPTTGEGLSTEPDIGVASPHEHRMAASLSPPRSQLRAHPDTCIGCHGRLPPLLPPFGPFPFPPATLPLLRNIPGSLPSGGGDKKQCDIQYQNDTRICARQPKPQDIAICRASASERLAYCNSHDGEVGTPSLDTAKRLRGR